MSSRFTLLETLIGNDEETHPIRPLQKEVPEDDVVKEVREIIGTKDRDVAKILATIALSHHYTAFDIDSKLIPVRQARYQDYLISDERGMCLVPPADLENAAPTSYQEVVIQYVQGSRTCSIFFRGREWVVRCNYMENRLFLQWPKEFGIRGALDVEDYSQIVTLPIKARYPTHSVVEKLKVNTAAQTVLEKTDLFHEFFFSDSEDEALGIFVLALYLYVNSHVS